MKIEIYGPGCPKCQRLFQNARDAVENLHLNAEVVKVEDIKAIVNAGVMITPAFAVNGEVKSAGKVLSVDEIKGVLS